MLGGLNPKRGEVAPVRLCGQAFGMQPLAGLNAPRVCCMVNLEPL